jgi:hypothetical protein
LERKDRTGPQPIADAIRLFLRESGLRRPRGDESVFQAWIDAAGSVWSARAVPTAFRGGQLTVEVTSAVHLSELKGYHSEAIRARANSVLGEARIRKVIFKLTI